MSHFGGEKVAFVYRLITVLSISLGLGCSNPPQAPDDLETLLGYLFEHMDDDDPEALTIGLENLYVWFQDDAQLQRAREGFLVCCKNAVARLDDKERSASGLEGITQRRVHFVQGARRPAHLGGFWQYSRQFFDV